MMDWMQPRSPIHNDHYIALDNIQSPVTIANMSDLLKVNKFTP